MNDYAQVIITRWSNPNRRTQFSLIRFFLLQTSVPVGINTSPTSAASCNSAASMAAAAAAAHFYQQQQQLHAAAAAAAAMDHGNASAHHQPLAAAAAVAAAAVGSVDSPRYPWMSITGMNFVPSQLVLD